MTKPKIKSLILKGEHPERFGTYLGSGSFRDAFRVGKYVVKQHCDFNQQENAEIHKARVRRRTGIMFAKQELIKAPNGTVWAIQEFYKPVCDNRRLSKKLNDLINRTDANFFLDLCENNVGRTKTGKFIAFDW